MILFNTPGDIEAGAEVSEALAKVNINHVQGIGNLTPKTSQRDF